MVADTQQLAAIYEEIKNVFSDHPNISVKPTKGNPPEQYEAHYTIQGIFKDEGGRIQHSSNHVVIITIPFGFPHFPPSCKPKTPIFHPDFDPAAICLGDFWQHDRSISELILFIGKMISGEVYSKENTFNEQAALWYRENTDRLPFAKIEGIPEATATTPHQTAALSESIEIDTLEDDDFTSDFNLLGIDHEKESSPPVRTQDISPERQSLDFDPEKIWLLSRQKRFYQLRDLLQSLSSDVVFEGKEDLSALIKDSIKEAKKIYHEGEELEHRGLPAKALEKFKVVEEKVSDYPKIQEDIRRTEQAQDLLGDWVQRDETSPKDTKPQGKNGKKVDKSQPVDQSPADTKVTMYNDRQRKQINIVPIALLIGLTVIIAPLVYIFLSNSNQYKRAEQLYKDCTEQMRTLKFKDAEQSCGAAITLAKEVTFIKKQESIELLGKLEALLNSDEMRQGLAGNILVNGDYLPIAQAELLKKSQNLIQEGDKFAASQDWKKAVDTYNLVLLSLKNDTKIDPGFQTEISKKINHAQANLSIQEGDAAMGRDKWQEAREHYQKALVEIRSFPAEEQKSYQPSLQSKIDKCTFLLLKKQGEEMFASSNWTEAFALFQKAIQLGTRLDQSEEITLNSIQADATRAGLYSTINEGKEAFSNSNWDEAIRKYANASKILMDNPGLLSKGETELNLQKLSRIMLQASIIRDQQEADTFIADKEYSEAIIRLKQIVKAIDSSPLKEEKELSDFRKKAISTLSKVEKEKEISDKIAYLEQHYKNLFAQNYPVSSQESLSTPVITFVKDDGEKQLFRLQCVENGRGKPFTLVMFYSYSKTTGDWSFYSSSDK